jgi:hypothetical protein
MSSKLEELLDRTLSALERRNKPLPPLPRPKRPQRLTTYFLPSPPHPSDSPPLASPKSPTSPATLSGFTLFPTPPAPLSQRPCLDQKAPVPSKAVDERMALLDLENTHLRQQNKVLFKQNLDYRELIQEYRDCCDKAAESTAHSKELLDVIEQIALTLKSDINSYEAARGSVRRAERAAIRDWKRFAIENASIGIDVDELAQDLDTMEITVYPYAADPNMI